MERFIKRRNSTYKFIIKRIKSKSNVDLINKEKEKEFETLKEIEKQREINRAKIVIEKNAEINIEPIDYLSIDKNKIVNNQKEFISQQKPESLNIERTTPKREIKITSRRILKKNK